MVVVLCVDGATRQQQSTLQLLLQTEEKARQANQIQRTQHQ